MAKKQANEVAVSKNNLPAEMDMEELAGMSGAGMEGADKDSFAIPFLTVLQKGSPQVDPDSQTRVKGAEPGMFFNSVTGKFMDGRKGISVIACAYQRKWIRWASRKNGGGFKGEFNADQIADMISKKELVTYENRMYIQSGAKVNPDADDLVSDTRNHYLLLCLPDGYQTVVLSLSATQIKKSRQLLSALSVLNWELPNGKKFNPPTFAVKLILKTVPESNDKGTWSGVAFEIGGRASADDYAAAKHFYNQITSGQVTTQAPAVDAGGDIEHAKGF